MNFLLKFLLHNPLLLNSMQLNSLQLNSPLLNSPLLNSPLLNIPLFQHLRIRIRHRLTSHRLVMTTLNSKRLRY